MEICYKKNFWINCLDYYFIYYYYFDVNLENKIFFIFLLEDKKCRSKWGEIEFKYIIFRNMNLYD